MHQSNYNIRWYERYNPAKVWWAHMVCGAGGPTWSFFMGPPKAAGCGPADVCKNELKRSCQSNLSGDISAVAVCRNDSDSSVRLSFSGRVNSQFSSGVTFSLNPPITLQLTGRMSRWSRTPSWCVATALGAKWQVNQASIFTSGWGTCVTLHHCAQENQPWSLVLGNLTADTAELSLRCPSPPSTNPPPRPRTTPHTWLAPGVACRGQKRDWHFARSSVNTLRSRHLQQGRSVTCVKEASPPGLGSSLLALAMMRADLSEGVTRCWVT